MSELEPLENPDMVEVTIHMPRYIHEDLSLRARLSDSDSVPEFLRRGAAIYSNIVEAALDNGILEQDTILEITLRTTRGQQILRPIYPFASYE